MDMTAAIRKGEFVTVVILEGLQKAGFGGDHVVHFEVV